MFVLSGGIIHLLKFKQVRDNMIYKVFLIFVSLALFTQVSAKTLTSEADEIKKGLAPSALTVKDDLVYSVADNKVFSGKVIIKAALKPSYLTVKNGVISEFFVFNGDDFTKMYYQQQMKHYSKGRNNNKHLEIKYLNGGLNKINMTNPTSTVNALFDENSNVIEYEAVYDEKDFIIRFKNHTMLYLKKSTNTEMKRIEQQDQEYRKDYMKLNNIFTKIDSALPSYKSLLKKLSVPAKKPVAKKKKITLEECQTMLGDEEFSRLKAKFSFDAALLGFCNAKANDASLNIK